MSDAPACRDPGCGRLAAATSPFCESCERWIWLAVLLALLGSPPPALRLLGLLEDNVELLAENARLRAGRRAA